MYVKTKCENNYIISYVKKLKTTTKIDLNNKKVDVTINGNGSLLEVNCKIDLEDPKTTKKIEEDIKEEINRIINKATNLIQNTYQTDVLGYGMKIHKTNPKQWNKIKNNWDNIFQQLEISTKINIDIKSKGSLIQTIEEENNEK